MDEVRGDDLTIHIEADGPFRVAVPLPIDSATDAATWQSILRTSTGDATIEVVDTWAWITGNDTTDVEARMRRADVGALDASWDGADRPITTLPIHTEGPLDLISIRWEATLCRGEDCDAPRDVTVCSLIFAASASGLSAGQQVVPVRVDNLQCHGL